MKSLAKTFGALAAGLVLASGCARKNTMETITIEREINVSETQAIDNSTTGWGEISTIRYCGMPSSNTFSISGKSHISANFYYPANAKEINYHGKRLEVISVTPEKIKLKYIRTQSK